MTENELKKAIREVVKKNFLGRKITFKVCGDEDETFKVAAYKIRSRKSIGIEHCEYEDYGVDEDTVKFIIVEFWDAEDEYSVTGCVCCIFTLNEKGQIGTSDAPYTFDLTVAYDTAIDMTDLILQEYNKQKKESI